MGLGCSNTFASPSYLNFGAMDKFKTPYQGTLVDFGGGNTFLLKADAFPSEKSDKEEVNNGIHAYQTLEIAQAQISYSSKTYVFRATIPAGTPFYVGYDGDVVAEELVIERVLDGDDTGKYRIPEWMQEQNELQTQLKVTLEYIDGMTEKLEALKKQVTKAEAEEYKAKKAYDRGFEAGKKLTWKPKHEQLEALQRALVRSMGDGYKEEYLNLQSLFYDLQKLFSEK